MDVRVSISVRRSLHTARRSPNLDAKFCVFAFESSMQHRDQKLYRPSRKLMIKSRKHSFRVYSAEDMGN